MVNPCAGRLRDNPHWLPRIRAQLGGEADWLEFPETPDIGLLVTEIQRRQPRRIIVCGGDGTLHRVATALHAAYPSGVFPELVVVPFGSMNTTASALGPARRPLDTLKAALRTRSGRIMQCPCLLIELENGHQLIGFTAAAGLVERFFDRYRRSPRGGLGTALPMALDLYWGALLRRPAALTALAPRPCRVAVEDQWLVPESFSLVLSSVLQNVGLGFSPNRRIHPQPNRLHLVAAPLDGHQLATQAHRMLLGLPLVGEGVFDGLVREWSLRFAEPGGMVIDGEVYASRTFRVRPGPSLPLYGSGARVTPAERLTPAPRPDA